MLAVSNFAVTFSKKSCLKVVAFSFPRISVCERRYAGIYEKEINDATRYLHTSACICKVYTKTGDKGMTSLYTGARESKDSLFFHALGNTDELSSHIGLAKEFASEKKHDFTEQLERIQCILQDIGTLIASPKEGNENEHLKQTFNSRHVGDLEEWIDKYTALLPPLTNFVLPGGGKLSAFLHVARTICRRTERSLVPLVNENYLDQQVLIYINRLSDYLFTVARYSTLLDERKETIYIRPQPAKVNKAKENVKGNQEIKE